MARRWQLSVWVLAGLVLMIAALWDSATMSAVTDRASERTETIDESVGPAGRTEGRPDQAFGAIDGSELATFGGANVLRPTTTTTTTRPTTTTTTDAPGDVAVNDHNDDGDGAEDGQRDPDRASTSTTVPGTSSTTVDRSSTTVPGDPALTTVYYEDFAAGSLADGQWEIASSSGFGGWGLLRPSSVSIDPDPSAAGGHVLAIVARIGTGEEAGNVVSGGVRLLGHGLAEGRYSVRARVDPDSNEATSGLILLHPGGTEISAARDEIRIMETNRNRWHVYTVDRTADQVAVSIDGGKPLVLTDVPPQLSAEPMDLAMRVDLLDAPSAPGEQPTLSGEVRMVVDWIRIERNTNQTDT